MAYSAPLQSNVNKVQTGTTDLTITYGSSCTPGSLLLFSFLNGTNTTLPTVSDPTNGNWTVLNSKIKSATVMGLYGVINTASSALTITAAKGGVTSSFKAAIYEWSGGPSTITGIVDSSAATNPVAGTTSSGGQPSITTTNTNCLIFTTLSNHTTNITAVTTSNGTGAGSYSRLQDATTGAITISDSYAVMTVADTENPFFSWTTSVTPSQMTTALVPAATVTTISSSTLSLLGVG